MNDPRRTAWHRFPPAAVALAAVLALALPGALALVPGQSTAATPSLGQLHSALHGQQARAQSLSASISQLNGVIASLDSQISLVQGREATASAELAADRARLAKAQTMLDRERERLAVLRKRLALARTILSDQLRAGYESSQPDIVSVILSADGFTQLLDQLNYLGMAQHRQQAIISFTRSARARADAAAARLGGLQRQDRRIAAATALRARALAGMNELLQSRQAVVSRAREAQGAALAAVSARADSLRHQISHVEAVQAAAARRAAAAAAAAQQAANASPVALGPTGGSGGWSIPYPIVLCESGGQNLPPNSAGASGYYQIIPSTWKLFGGTGPAAYLASKAEQDAVAARIWRGGAGASNWVCAGIVGIH
ncbi:MAG: transglycosylase family protein [Solirubrobacteraceae bacterium]